jgi:hypothetical protein
MATTSRTRGTEGNQGAGVPVTSGIRRAARRIGLEPAESELPTADLDRTDEELDVLRELVRKVLRAYEHDGISHPTRAALLGEVLKCARDDMELLENAEEPMMFLRAQYRVDIGFMVADYLDSFGYPESDEYRAVREKVEAEQGRAVGGAS